MITESLQQIWDSLPVKSDKGSVHSYLPVYEELLKPYRETANNVLEIGLFNGASLVLWESYFTKAKVFGIDCDIKPHGGMADLTPLIPFYNISIGNAESKEDIKRFYKGIKFDVIIEDAGHDIEQQVRIYEVMKPYLAEGGIYIIEDVQDIDRHKVIFELLDKDKKIEIIDRRKVKGRYDDVLIVIR